MARLITPSGIEEGDIFNRWLHSRMIRKNQNVLAVASGPTGSGKSYSNLRICELWYKYHFNETFPARTHVCFSVGEIMRLISSGKLRKGELLILEESGVNMSSLDFQKQVSKMFNSVLQSFRSMNVGILFNLPVLTMLNKSIRYLIHAHLITNGIDYTEKRVSLKPLFRQVNESSGKIYNKFLRIKYQGKIITVKQFKYSLPEIETITLYEAKKLKFVQDLTSEFAKQLEELDRDNLMKLGRKSLTDREQEVFNLRLEGNNGKQIAEIIGISQKSVSEALQRCRKKGFDVKLKKKHKENVENGVKNHNKKPF